MPGTGKKMEVEDWAAEAYPLAWQELVKFGQSETPYGEVLFNIERREVAA